ncbi:MAG: ThuA domain-containing protein [Terriglobia bacterium]
MKRLGRDFGLLLFLLLPGLLLAADSKPDAKLKAVLITGGGYHDFKSLSALLTDRISQYANVDWEVKWGPEVLEKADFAQAADVVVYDMCFDETVLPSINHVLNLTRGGKPTVVIHCAVHSFKESDEWRRLVGEVSRIHDKYEPIASQKVDPNHPIIKSFPDNWQTAGDELYQTIQMGPDSKSLLKVKSPASGIEHIVCWTNQYGQGRVFGTTLGHDMKTAQQEEYQRLLAYGLLWACGKLDEQGKPLPGYEGKTK